MRRLSFRLQKFRSNAARSATPFATEGLAVTESHITHVVSWSLRGAMAMAKDRRSVCIAAYRGLLVHAGDSSFESVSFRVTSYIFFTRPLTPVHSYQIYYATQEAS